MSGSGWKLAFPASRTCLWDNTSIGEVTELSKTKNGCLLVQISSSALQLALNHARSTSSKTMDCFMIASSWINEAENITLEVNRFDPGRLTKTGITPTSIMHGDIAMRTQVVFGSHPDSKYLVYNLNSIQEALSELKQRLSLNPTATLDPSHLLSFRLHCCCSHEGAITVQCACISPYLVYQSMPIKPIPIISTALARNLSGPLPLSAMQGRIKHGYVTMESSRKLVLSLHSDSIVSTLPLVGVWVSGVETVNHPLVWAACVAYTNSSGLTDRVWGDDDDKTFICLVYYEGCSQPSFWECKLKDTPEGNGTPSFEIGSGETMLKLSSEHNLIGVRIYPSQESTTLHTLLETAMASGSSSDGFLQSLPRNVSHSISKSNSSPFPKSNPPQISPKVLPRDLSHSQSLSKSSSPSLPRVPPHSDLQNEVSLDLPLPLPLPTPSKAPQRVNNLSVISSLSILDSSYVSIPEANEQMSQSSPRDKKTDDAIVSPAGHYTNKSTPTLEVTTPTNELSPQTHQIFQQYEHQLKSLQDGVRCLLQAQSPIVPVVTSPVTPTVDACTNTGKSLCWPSLSPVAQCSDYDEETIGPSITSADFSVQTSTTSMLSHSTENMHLDLHSFANSSSLQGFDDSVSISTCEDPPSERINPLAFPSQNQKWTTEDILADALEKVKILERLQSQKRASPPKPNEQDSKEHSSLFSHSHSGLSSRNSSQRILNGVGERLTNCCFSSTGSIEQNCSSSGRYQVESADMLPGVENRAQTIQTRSTNSSLSSCTSEDDQPWEDRGRQDDKTPTPPRGSTRSEYTGHAECPIDPYMDKSEPVQHLNKKQVPFMTPLSARNGGPSYHLHPDVLYQQYSPDISMLPVPRIVCPNSGDTILFTALMGNDVTVDENVYMADMITQKYLQGLDDNRNLTGRRSKKWDPPGSVDVSTGGAITNMSMATHQYFQRHNLLEGGMMMPTGRLERTKIKPRAADKKLLEVVSADTLDIQTLKTLPKLI